MKIKKKFTNQIRLDSAVRLSPLILSGFTLVELVVVIAVLGVLAAVLLVLINPADKINSANDAGVISNMEQLGKLMDSYAVNHNGSYPGGASYTVANTMTDLNTAGETKLPTLSVPSGYTYNYASAVDNTGTSCTTVGQSCKIYQVWVGLKSKKYTSQSQNFYWYINGKGCFQAAAPVQTNPWSTCP